ncbi:1,4-dihydroxy-2-naphthoate prenyltransferase, partial [Listeria monocytogenes]
MFFIATGLGVWLVFRTDLLVLLIGFVCFCIGILYTFGPVPLSRMPLGEIFSGVTMGFGIFFLAVYVNAYDA